MNIGLYEPERMKGFRTQCDWIIKEKQEKMAMKYEGRR